MMCRIINQSYEYDMENLKFLSKEKFSYLACSKEKLVIKPSKLKVDNEAPDFLKRI